MSEGRKRGYYIHFQGRLSVGVSKKIDMQLDEFRRYYDMQEIEVGTIQRNFLQRLVGLFPTKSIARDYGSALKQVINPDFVYIRRTVADKFYVQFMRDIKRKYPNCKIIIEIFTYPYDKDNFGKWDAWPFYIKERIYRPRLKKYVDRFVTYTQDEEIFGVPTIRTANGIKVDSVKQVSGYFTEKQINLIAVAFMQRHHGYERIIEGLHQYYSENLQPEYQVRMHLVGDGPEKPLYEELVRKYQLENYIIFYPTMSGDELDTLYDTCDIALASFGMYKIGLTGKMSALKTRECLAKGMPMLTGCAIDVLDDTYPYAKLFPNDGSAVDIVEIVDFYKKLRNIVKDKQEMADIIRRFAVAHVSMETVMRPIIDYIQ